MFNKIKIRNIVLAFVLLLIGGLAFTAYQVGAVGGGSGHKFGFWKGEFSGIDKNSEEWKAKMEEFKLKKAENNGEWKGYGDEVNYEIVDITNGIQITITSDNSDIVQKLQDMAAKKRNYLDK